jgi:hypothetical protein
MLGGVVDPAVFFASTVVYALAAGSKNWAAITREFGGWFTLHGAIMVIGGLASGLAIIQAAVLPRWTAACLMAGVVMVLRERWRTRKLRAIRAR